jgi:hypothetical protein
MPTLSEVAKNFADRIISARTQMEVQIILNEIDSLVYEKNNIPISLDDKESLLQAVYNILQPYAIKTFDNKNYLELIRYMMQQIRANKK